MRAGLCAQFSVHVLVLFILFIIRPSPCFGADVVYCVDGLFKPSQTNRMCDFSLTGEWWRTVSFSLFGSGVF